MSDSEILEKQPASETAGAGAKTRAWLPQERFRWWVIVIGAALIPVNSLWISRTEALDYSGFPTCASLFYNVVFSIIMLMVLNIALRRFVPRFAFGRRELLVVYGMVATGSSLVGHDFMEILVPTIPHARYFASPENKWEQLIIPHLPSWLTIDTVGEGITSYQLGHSTLYTWDHLRLWMTPIACWSVFLIAIVISMLCINIIVRRQWMEHERLTYPVVQIPIIITEGGGSNPLFRNRVFWIGFALAAGLDLWNGFGQLYPSIPQLNVKINDLSYLFAGSYPWKAMDRIWLTFYPWVIGLCYFMPTNMSFSSWFFFIFRKGMQVCAAALGYEGSDIWYPYVREQAYGAWIALFVVTLWLGRGYLKEVWRAAVTGQGQTDDGGVSYRWTLIALGLAMFVMMAFLAKAGMSPIIAVVYVLLYLLFCGAITRMRAELGPPAHEIALVSTTQMMVLGLGTTFLGPQNLTIFSLMWFQNRTYRGLLMPQQAESLKAARDSGLRLRTMVIALVIAGVVGIISGFWAHLHVSYSRLYHGGHIGAPGSGFAQEHYRMLENWLKTPVAPDVMGVAAIGIGAATALFLSRMNTLFSGFPFHPAGYALGMAWGLDYIWGPLIISWALKVIILKYWGLRGYRAAMPFFVGLVLGEFVVGGMWSFMRGVFGIQAYTFFY